MSQARDTFSKINWPGMNLVCLGFMRLALSGLRRCTNIFAITLYMIGSMVSGRQSFKCLLFAFFRDNLITPTMVCLVRDPILQNYRSIAMQSFTKLQHADRTSEVIPSRPGAFSQGKAFTIFLTSSSIGYFSNSTC